jgi:uncharacterized membrane protein YphA (DoxX/SURF4 family)
VELLWLIARCILAVVLVTAAVGKLADRPGSRRALEAFRIPSHLAGVASLALPIVEVGLAAGLLVNGTATRAAVGSLILLLMFCAVITQSLIAGNSPECHCFGQIQSEPAGVSTLVRNGLLAGTASFVVLFGPGRSLSSVDSVEAALLITSASTTFLAILAYGMYRKLIVARESSGAPGADLDIGLPAGTQVPALRVTRLDGTEEPLADIIGGRPSLLVHVGLRCKPCHELMPELIRWRTALAQELELLVVTSGDLEDGREYAADHEFDDLLISTDLELPIQLRMASTPGAVSINREMRIDGPPVFGGMAIEHLVRQALRRSEAQATATS